MPGWYIHTEAAKQAVDRLRAGVVPPDFPGGAQRAKQLGNISYKWRNYLALGAIGPDIFYLLPDFKPPFGNDLMAIINWYLQVWSTFEDLVLKSWDKYAQPAVRGQGAILNQVTGGLLREIGQAHQELASALKDLVIDVAAHLWDWFGIFSSGVPQGFSDKAFFWSDMFHYRRTYSFAQRLFLNAQKLCPPNATTIEDQKKCEISLKLQAFALGWMTHCATDVTGHPFVNEKVGGPWRLHWMRHHLVENHMDAKIYDTQHHGTEPFGQLDTSCLHFRLAFRHRNDGDYTGPDGKGFDDAPAYDYFAGFPPYDTSDTDSGDANRETLFDLDSGDLSDELCTLIIETMKDVYGDENSPHFLTGGRPTPQDLKNTFQILYDYVKRKSSSGYSVPPPTPPTRFNDHSPPPFPVPHDDAARGSDPQQDPIISDVLFAIYAFALWLADFGVWLVTLPEQVAADLLTWPARDLLYYVAVNPLYSLYIAARQPLVMMGFVEPKHIEISQGLVQLGVPPSAPIAELISALSTVGGVRPSPPGTAEPSGRSTTTPSSAFTVDPSYPRSIIEDDKSLIAKALEYLKSDIFCGQTELPSEFLRPWRYPGSNNAGQLNGGELEPSHPGPWFQGQSAEVLMNTSPGDPTARHDFEMATSPTDTEGKCDKHFPAGRHLGDPVDYSVYLIGRLTNGDNLPDFNLDSDRGYAYHCWDWNRNPSISVSVPNLSNPIFNFTQPCTVPEGFCNQSGGPLYDPLCNLDIYYLDQGMQDRACPKCPTFR